MNIARQDTLPEGMKFPDDGCHEEPSCLNCKLPQCIYDTGAFQFSQEKKAERDRRIFELRKQGVPPVDLARQFRLSPRSVLRIIQRGGPSERSRQLELDDVQGKPTSEIRSPIHAPRALPVMRENARRAAG